MNLQKNYYGLEIKNFEIGDLIKLKENISCFFYMSNIPDYDFNQVNIFEVDPIYDVNYGGILKKNDSVIVIGIICKNKTPVIYECLYGNKKIYLYYTKNMCPDICFTKCN